MDKLTKRVDIFDAIPLHFVSLFLIFEINSLNPFRNSKCYSQCFTSQVLRKLIEKLQVKIQFSIFLPCNECRIQFDRKHIECALKLILHGYALAKWWLKSKWSRAHELVVINGLVHLCYSYFVSVVHWLVWVLIRLDDASCLAWLIFLHHWIVNYVKLVIENNIAIYFTNNVVFNKN